MFGIGFTELLVIFLVVFLLFGPKALSEIARTMGEVVRIFRREAGEFRKELESAAGEKKSDPSKPSPRNGDKVSEDV